MNDIKQILKELKVFRVFQHINDPLIKKLIVFKFELVKPSLTTFKFFHYFHLLFGLCKLRLLE